MSKRDIQNLDYRRDVRTDAEFSSNVMEHEKAEDLANRLVICPIMEKILGWKVLSSERFGMAGKGIETSADEITADADYRYVIRDGEKVRGHTIEIKTHPESINFFTLIGNRLNKYAENGAEVWIIQETKCIRLFSPYIKMMNDQNLWRWYNQPKKALGVRIHRNVGFERKEEKKLNTDDRNFDYLLREGHAIGYKYSGAMEIAVGRYDSILFPRKRDR